MHSIVLASGNSKKLKELEAILSGTNVSLLPQTALGIPDAVEDGLSFVENAIIKARHACRLSGLPAIADDSGLEVDALQGAPGIYSARFAAETKHGNSHDEANNQKLLALLRDVPTAQRSARFQCVIVFMRHAEDPTPLICQGTWEGLILSEPAGEGGFGYDPLFYVPTHACASAQLPPAEKNRISHRGQALQQLMQHISMIDHVMAATR
jgi:XTP/dITP diphosphohydrolase